MDEPHTIQRHGTIIVSLIIAVRSIAAPLFLYTFANGFTAWALCPFVVAVFTDALADFLFVLAGFGALVFRGLYPFWVLLLIIVMFAQFVLTSKLARPIYDPLGKYYGVFLFCAIGATLALPHPSVYLAVMVFILGFTIASVISRTMFLLSSKKRMRDQDSPDP